MAVHCIDDLSPPCSDKPYDEEGQQERPEFPQGEFPNAREFTDPGWYGAQQYAIDQWQEQNDRPCEPTPEEEQRMILDEMAQEERAEKIARTQSQIG